MNSVTHSDQMRYFAELSYLGTAYSGWQRQPNAVSVQQTIEEALATILRSEIVVTGCGRTDTGVHASQYFLHFDYNGEFPEAFLHRLNKVLPKDIAFQNMFDVPGDAHARFDAKKRSYIYRIDLLKNPFNMNLAWSYPPAARLDVMKLQEIAALISSYDSFAPFCKSNTDVKTMDCDVQQARWEFDSENYQLLFRISANRFLRGMVRLIVGACVNYAEDKISLRDVKVAMDTQSPLPKSLSVPAEGLYLSEILY